MAAVSVGNPSPPSTIGPIRPAILVKRLFGGGGEFAAERLEARVAAQGVPVRIQAQVAVGRAVGQAHEFGGQVPEGGVGFAGPGFCTG